MYKQPFILIDFLSTNRKSSSHILLCALMETDADNQLIIEDTIDKWKMKMVHVSSLKYNIDLGSFLESLSQAVISAKLRPMILHLF